jgi:hypothetical protein
MTTSMPQIEADSSKLSLRTSSRSTHNTARTSINLQFETGYRPLSSQLKPVSDLTVQDLIRNPVWAFSTDESDDETRVFPVDTVPVTHTDGKVFGTIVRASGGVRFWARIANVHPTNRRMNQHFLTVAIYHEAMWIELPRYHDLGFDESSYDHVARTIGLAPEELFPIVYDLRQLIDGDPDVLTGEIPRQPSERLSSGQLIALALDE